MSLGTYVKDLRDMLKAEVGVGVGSATTDAMFTTLISNKQRWFCAAWDWPFLASTWTTAVAGRYNSVPATDRAGVAVNFNKERPLLVEVKFNDLWEPLDYGIGGEDYSTVDSDAAETQDPIQKWQYYGTTQFEVWPIPASSQSVRFSGQKEVAVLTSDVDEVTLDDLLLVYSVAADYLKRLKQADWMERREMASMRFMQLRANYPQKTQECVLGGGELERDSRLIRVVPIVTTA